MSLFQEPSIYEQNFIGRQQKSGSNVIHFDFTRRNQAPEVKKVEKNSQSTDQVVAEAKDFLADLDRKLDVLDEACRVQKTGPLSLLLCNLEAFALGYELDQRQKQIKNLEENRAS